MDRRTFHIIVLLLSFIALPSLAENLFNDVLSDTEEQIRLAAQKVLRSPSNVAAVEKFVKDLNEAYNDGTGCQCVGYNCGCCLHMNIRELHINDDACVNASYLPRDYGISVTMNIGRLVVLNMTVSARNPPPICFGIPHFHKAGSLCIDFYNLDVSKTSFSGCIRLEAHLVHVIVKKLDLGCFRIPLNGLADYRRATVLVQALNTKRNETLRFV